MGSLLVSLVPYGLAAAAAAPAAAVFAALVLSQAKRPVMAGWVFVAGAAGFDALFAVIVLGIYDAMGVDTTSDLGDWIDVALGALFLLIGLVALFSKDSPEKDEKRRARATELASSDLKKLVVVGVVVQLVNADALAVAAGGLKEIAIAEVSTAETLMATFFLFALVLVVYYLPVVLYGISPTWTAPRLEAFSEWLFGHSRPVEIVTGLVLGSVFLVKGLSALA